MHHPNHIARISRLGGFALLAASITLGCENGDAPAPQGEVSAEPGAGAQRAEGLSGHRVEVVVVQPSLSSLSLMVPGEVEGYRDAMLASPMGGYIERVAVDKGDRVKAGQPLIWVDQNLHGVRLARAKVELASAERELGRAKSLGASIPRAEIDSAEDRVHLAEAALKELNLNVSRAVVRAPFSGYVARLDAEVGEVAAPGAPLLRLVQLQPINVSVTLSDRDVALAKEGGTAKVQLDARSGIAVGKVTSVAKVADLKTRAFEAIVELPNADELALPGMIASVTLETTDAQPAASSEKGKSKKATKEDDKPAETKKGLIVSQDWVVTRPEGIGVFVEEAGKAVWRQVELGEIVRKQVEVKGGLRAGDALIIVGHRELVDGDKVLVHRRGSCCVEGRARFDD